VAKKNLNCLPESFAPSLLCCLPHRIAGQPQRILYSRGDLPAGGRPKKMWCARFDFRRPLRLPYFARLIIFFFSQSPQRDWPACRSPLLKGSRKDFLQIVCTRKNAAENANQKAVKKKAQIHFQVPFLYFPFPRKM